MNKSWQVLSHTWQNTRKRVRSGPGAEFLNFGTACIYLDRVKLDTSNFANSCNVTSTSQRMSNYSTIFPSWSCDPFKNCCDWICTKQKGDHQVGNLHVNYQHLVISVIQWHVLRKMLIIWHLIKELPVSCSCRPIGNAMLDHHHLYTSTCSDY